MTRKILGVMPALLLICSLSAAWAIPMAKVTFLETEVGGSYQYEFIVANTSDDPVADAGLNLYSVALDFYVPSGTTGTTNIAMPTNSAGSNSWESFTDDGTRSSGFIEMYSIEFGPPPVGADIAPGDSLGGFVFQFDDRLNGISFEASLAKLAYDDFGNVLIDEGGLPILIGEPVSYSGSVTPGSVTPVPEPATLALVCTGLVGMGLYIRRKRTHSIQE
jgi:hypothetical protein